MQTRLLSPAAVEESTNIAEVVSAVEDAFAAYARDAVIMPAKSYIDLPEYNGDFRSMPAYLDAESWDAAGIKWVNVHPDNPDRFDLPTVMGTIIYSDPETAFPLAIMDGTTVTKMRTGAAAAVATKHLAREDAQSLGLVGTGAQAYTQLEAIATVRDITDVIVSDIDEEAIEAFIDAFEGRFDVREGSIEEAATCDVLSTVTPVEKPIVQTVEAGTHVNAMGADAAGKHEIDDRILLNSTLVIDDYEQCVHSGEINVPWSQGTLDDENLYGELGEVVVGEKPGRTTEAEVTIFDSTGLAIQDVATAHVIYEHAEERDVGERFPIVGTGV